MDENKEFQIVYSMRIMRALVEQGEFPVKTIPNPKDTKYNCWIFKNTESFQKKLEAFHTW